MEGIRACYVILSHRNAEQVQDLMSAIRRSSPAANVFVYHDGRQEEAPQPVDQNCVVTEHRHPMDWGSWDLAVGTLEALRLASETFDANMYVLISGQDYPCRNLRQWECDFVQQGTWQGSATPLQYVARWGRVYGRGQDDLTRYTYLWARLPASRWLAASASAPARATRGFLFRLGHYLEPILDVRVVSRGRGLHGGIRNPCPPFSKDVPCVKGDQWLALGRPTLDRLLDDHQRRSWLRFCYKHSIIPDESYLQTLLNRWARPVGGRVSYVDWIPTIDAPKVLTLADLDAIIQSGTPFCRKIDLPESGSLMAALDSLI